MHSHFDTCTKLSALVQGHHRDIAHTHTVLSVVEYLAKLNIPVQDLRFPWQ